MSLAPAQSPDLGPEAVAVHASLPTRCVVVVDTEGGRCGEPAAVLLLCPSCMTGYPYCPTHRAQLVDALAAAGGSRVTCMTCRARMAPAWLPL